jgi:hypothetical protein
MGSFLVACNTAKISLPVLQAISPIFPAYTNNLPEYRGTPVFCLSDIFGNASTIAVMRSLLDEDDVGPVDLFRREWCFGVVIGTCCSGLHVWPFGEDGFGCGTAEFVLAADEEGVGHGFAAPFPDGQSRPYKLSKQELKTTNPRMRQGAAMIRHVVLVQFRANSDVETIFAALKALQGKIDGIQSISCGPDNSPEGLQRGHTHGFTVDFRDAKSRDAYLPHPEHQKVGGMIVAAAEGGIDGVTVLDWDLA